MFVANAIAAVLLLPAFAYFLMNPKKMVAQAARDKAKEEAEAAVAIK
jgi:hypothetical protein